uniref:Dockerin domain-containing protein n=1 Tax=Candidatus Methanogaster sp. ANME-2c ERB4 TaxID=2759911 RepID=A0A7G9YG35_9EURY|nr:hypothetical protein CLAIAILK_00030 [Methanosarcinales archaeon ANME-2c ERB4]
MIGMNGNTKHNIFRLCIVIALLGAFMGGASAAFNPEGYMGTVIGKDAGNSTFGIQTTYNWSDNWSHIGWQPNDTIMEWLFPNEDAANELCVGDYVEILGFAASPGEVIGLGRMNSSTEMFITDIYGDPNFLEPYWYSEPLDPPLLGNFTIKYSSTPNCSNCGMRNCEANYTNVTITNGTGLVEVDDHQLYPGQTCIYKGVEYRINITFYSGEASACPVCNDTCPPGSQPVSNFTIHIETVNQPLKTPRGDLNHDGNVTSADAVIALTIAASGGENYNADIDGDGKVTALDGLMILQAAADNIEI